MKKKQSKPEGLLEHLDAYTGAPARAAIAKLQDDFTALPEAAKAAYEQFGADPKEAPTGADLARNMQLEGLPAELAGIGLEFAADPTNAITGAAKLATLPLVGIKALKAADTASDVARFASKAEKMAEAARLAEKESNLIKAAKEAAGAENFKKMVRGSELAAEQAIVNQPGKAFMGVGGIVHSPTAEAGVRLANQNPSPYGRVIQLPDAIEARRIERLSKPAERFPTVKNIIRGRK